MVGEAIVRGSDFTSALKEFLDFVLWQVQAKGGYMENKLIPVDPEMIADEPPPIEDEFRRVYIAAMAEHLAHSAGIVPPAWCMGSDYYLRETRMAGWKTEADRDRIIAETPSAFRSRLIFCGPVMNKLHKILGHMASERG